MSTIQVVTKEQLSNFTEKLLNNDKTILDNAFENIPKALFGENEKKYITEEVSYSLESGYVDKTGKITVWGDTYSYTQKISVKAEDIITADAVNTSSGADETEVSIRFVCAYNDEAVVESSGSDERIRSYTVPNGVNYVTLTLDTKNYNSYKIHKKSLLETPEGDYVSNVVINGETKKIVDLEGRVLITETDKKVTDFVNGTEVQATIRSVVDDYCTNNGIANYDDTEVKKDISDIQQFLIKNEDGTKFLSNDGTYKNVRANEEDIVEVMKSNGFSKDELFDISYKHESEEDVPTSFTDGSMDNTGKISTWGTKYAYSTKIPVSTGDIIYVYSTKVSDGTVNTDSTMRMVTAFNKDTAIPSSGYYITNESYTAEYVVPKGIDGVVVTINKESYTGHIVKRKVASEKYTLKNDINSSFVSSRISCKDYITKQVATIGDGELVTLESNCISKNKTLSLSFTISDFTGGSIKVGHGLSSYNGSYLEITESNAKVFKRTGSAELVKQEAHGLTIVGVVNVLINVDNSNKAKIMIMTKGGLYTLSDVYWTGRSGDVFVNVSGVTLNDVIVNWYCNDYSKLIYAYGDSYFDLDNPARWTYYLMQNNFDNLLMDHYSGRNSLAAYNSFINSLKHGTPKFVLWCLGMNDPDTNTEINSNWETAITNVLNKCDELGIIPILCTIPNVKGGKVDDSDIYNSRNHDYKNNFVKYSGRRYIDFAKVVGAYESNEWYTGMLSSTDGVHPTELGAKALFMQALIDFPELMYKN